MLSTAKILLPLLTTLTTTTNALYFHLTSFRASDIRIPSESHSVSFTISNPDAVFEQGSSYPANCSLSWTTSGPNECWTPCTGGGWTFYTRICPSSHAGAYDFGLEIAEYGAYRNSVLYNTSIAIKEGESEYGCSRGGQSTQCNFRNEESSFDTDFETSYGPIAQQPGPLCEA